MALQREVITTHRLASADRVGTTPVELFLARYGSAVTRDSILCLRLCAKENHGALAFARIQYRCEVTHVHSRAPLAALKPGVTENKRSGV